MATYVGDKIYGWSDQNASPTTYYTDNTTLTRGMTLYNNQGVDTGERVGYIHDGMFEIEDYFSLYNENTSDQGGAVYTGSFTPKRNGYYKVTLIGAGGFVDSYRSGSSLSDYTYHIYSGGSGAGIIVEVYLEKTRTYSIQCGAGHYNNTGDSTYISYSDGTNTYKLDAPGGFAFGNPGVVNISSGWNIRTTILSTNGNGGAHSSSEGHAYPQPPIAGASSVISGTVYGKGADYTSADYHGSAEPSHPAGNGGYIEIQLIDS